MNTSSNLRPSPRHPRRARATAIKTAAAALALLQVTAVAPSQCPFASAQITAYGTGCPLSSSPLLLVQFHAAPCTLDVLFGASPTNLIGSWVGFSMSPGQSVLPELGSCPIMNSPFAMVTIGASGTLTVPLPTGLLPMTVYIDAVAVRSLTPFPGIGANKAVAAMRAVLQ